MVNWKTEYKKCLLDTSRIYMMKKYVFHEDLFPGLVYLSEHMKHNKILVVSKSRNVGYTTFMAALTACELALNSDYSTTNRESPNHTIVYVGPSTSMTVNFLRMVDSFLRNIPFPLFSTNEHVKCNGNTITVGNAKLIVTTDSEKINNRRELRPAYVIYDEVIAQRDKFDVESDIVKGYWKENADKIIIGGCGNHKNDLWFNFVKRLKKEFGPYVICKLPYDTNPHQGMTTSMCKCNHYDFDAYRDEFMCEIFHYTKVEEKL